MGGPVGWSWSFSPGGHLRFREAVVLKSEWVDPRSGFLRVAAGTGWHCLLVRCLKDTPTLRRIEARDGAEVGEGRPVSSTREETDNLLAVDLSL